MLTIFQDSKINYEALTLMNILNLKMLFLSVCQ